MICDSTTTKITLDVMNDSLAHNYSYRLIFSKKDIEVDVYNDDNNLYRSVFEYTDFTYENLKAKINKYNMQNMYSNIGEYVLEYLMYIYLYHGERKKCHLLI